MVRSWLTNHWKGMFWVKGGLFHHVPTFVPRRVNKNFWRDFEYGPHKINGTWSNSYSWIKNCQVKVSKKSIFSLGQARPDSCLARAPYPQINLSVKRKGPETRDESKRTQSALIISKFNYISTSKSLSPKHQPRFCSYLRWLANNLKCSNIFEPSLQTVLVLESKKAPWFCGTVECHEEGCGWSVAIGSFFFGAVDVDVHSFEMKKIASLRALRPKSHRNRAF